MDPCFNDQFRIADPTPAYAKATQALPNVFVGKEGRLIALVTLICEEIAASFHARGSILPPWREQRGVLSKWFPTTLQDIPVVSPRSCPHKSSTHSNSHIKHASVQECRLTASRLRTVKGFEVAETKSHDLIKAQHCQGIEGSVVT